MNDSKTAPGRQATGTLWTGPFAGGLEARCLEVLDAWIAEGAHPGLRILVPSREVRAHLRRRLTEEGIPTFDIRVQLLPELAESVLAAREGQRTIPGPPWRPLGGMAAQVLLAGLVRRWAESGPARGLRSVALQGGFLEALGSTFADLEEASVSATALAEGVTRAAVEQSDNGSRHAEFADLIDLYTRWEALLAERLLETRPRRMARAALGVEALPGRSLLVYGFYDLSGVQERLLRAMAIGRQCQVFAPRIEGPGADYARPFLDGLVALGLERHDIPDQGSTRPTLSLLSAAGERREAEAAVRTLIQRLDQRPIALHRVAFLYRAPDSHATPLSETLERAGIPAHRLDPPRLSETSAGEAARLLLAVLAADFSRRAVLDFLDVALPLRLAGAGADATRRLAAWDALTRDGGLIGGEAGWDVPLEQLERRLKARLAALLGAPESGDPGSGDTDGGGRIRRLELEVAALVALRAEIGPLFAGLRAVQEATTWSRFSASLRAELRRWLPATPEHERVAAALMELAAIDATGEPVDARLAVRALSLALESQRAPGAPEDPGGVFVGSVMAARGLSFDLVFLLGLNERVFPRQAAPDPLLRDAERIRLEAAGYRLPLHQRRRDEEAALFALTTRAAPDLVLSWSRVDPATGKPRLPSGALLELAAPSGRRLTAEELERRAERTPLDRMADAREAGARHPDRNLPFAAGDEPAGHEALDRPEFERLWVAAAVGAGQGGRLAGLASREPVLRRALLAEAGRWQSRRLTRWDGRMEAPAALEWLAARFPDDAAWSATTLESYARCPFRFFVESLLDAVELEEPEESIGLDPIDRGSLLHAILREFLAAPGGLQLVREEPEAARARLAEVTDSHLAEFEATGRVGSKLLWELERQRIRDDLADWFAFERERPEALETLHLEWPFGMPSSEVGMPASEGGIEDPASRVEPLRVGTDETRRLAFKGRIDRVDADPSGRFLRVIDYKTGRPPNGKRSAGFESGESLQLPIYLLAAAAGRGATGGIAEYLYLAGGTEQDTLAVPDLKRLEAELVARAGVLVDGLRAGLFFGYAGPASAACRDCRLAGVCGAGAEKRFARKREDPLLAPWLKLKGVDA